MQVRETKGVMKGPGPLRCATRFTIRANSPSRSPGTRHDAAIAYSAWNSFRILTKV